MDLVTLTRLVSKEKLLPKTAPHLRFLLPNNHAGGIIGYKGQNARRIQSQFDIFIQVYNCEGAKWGRLVDSKGQPEQLRQAWGEIILSLLDNYIQYYDTHGFGINFVLPTDLVDLFLLEGEFEHMAKLSMTRFTVKTLCLMRSTERVVRIETRSLDSSAISRLQKAVYLMAVNVQNNISIAMSAPGNVFYVENMEDNIYNYIHYADIENDILFDYSTMKDEQETTTQMIQDLSVHEEGDNQSSIGSVAERRVFDQDETSDDDDANDDKQSHTETTQEEDEEEVTTSHNGITQEETHSDIAVEEEKEMSEDTRSNIQTTVAEPTGNNDDEEEDNKDIAQTSREEDADDDEDKSDIQTTVEEPEEEGEQEDGESNYDTTVESLSDEDVEGGDKNVNNNGNEENKESKIVTTLDKPDDAEKKNESKQHIEASIVDDINTDTSDIDKTMQQA